MRDVQDGRQSLIYRACLRDMLSKQMLDSSSVFRNGNMPTVRETCKKNRPPDRNANPVVSVTACRQGL